MSLESATSAAPSLGTQKSDVELHRIQITEKDDAIITMLPLLESQSRDE
jgi:hypothetical protein